MDLLDAARERWRLKHRVLGLPDTIIGTPNNPGGLARRVKDLSTRLVVLPADPFSTRLSFDKDFWDWWGENRPAPFGRNIQWTDRVPSLDAAVKGYRYGDGWQTYLALHRHGGVEVGSQDSRPSGDDIRWFPLLHIVGLIWTGLDAQGHALGRVRADGPWEVTVTLYNTGGAFLENLGAGWAGPRDLGGTFAPRCPEPHVFIRRELETLPTDPDHVRGLALDLGGRIEDAWGVKQRRFLDQRGERKGDIDLRHWQL